jgi:hypothetical protein
MKQGELIERITRLEQQQAEHRRTIRRFRLATGALLLFAGAVVLMAQMPGPAQNQSLEAEQFVLRDSAGNVRGVMGTGENGEVGINLNDTKGQSRITIDVSRDGSPGVDLYDQNGKLRATIALGPSGTPGLGLYDSNGKLRTAIDIPAAQTPGLSFYHSDGRPAWGAP